MATRPLIAGNWKMHGLAALATELKVITAGVGELAWPVDPRGGPPATLIAGSAALASGDTLTAVDFLAIAQPYSPLSSRERAKVIFTKSRPRMSKEC
jgi:hypothetical protein